MKKLAAMLLLAATQVAAQNSSETTREIADRVMPKIDPIAALDDYAEPDAGTERYKAPRAISVPARLPETARSERCYSLRARTTRPSSDDRSSVTVPVRIAGLDVNFVLPGRR